jgi:hypothetical protein
MPPDTQQTGYLPLPDKNSFAGKITPLQALINYNKKTSGILAIRERQE